MHSKSDALFLWFSILNVDTNVFYKALYAVFFATREGSPTSIKQEDTFPNSV